MTCSRRSPFKPHAGASTSMLDSSRVCRRRTTPCTKRYSATRSHCPCLSVQRVDIVAALPATMLGTSSSLSAILPIWSSAAPPRRRSTGVAPLDVVMGHATPSQAGGLGARPVAHVRQGARGMQIYGFQCKEGTQCGLPPSFFELTLSSPQFPHEVAKRGKRKEEIYLVICCTA